MVFERSLDNLQLPSSLFTCKTLVKLHLSCESGFGLGVPAIVILPNLEDLYLENCFSYSCDFERLLSNSPVLQYFVFTIEGDDNRMDNGNAKLIVSNPTLKHLSISCYHLEIVIDAPNLVSLDYISLTLDSHTFKNVQSLARAKIYVQPDPDYEQYFILAAIDLMRGISNVSTLEIRPGTLHDLQRLNIPIPAFHNLTQLALSYSFDLDFAGLLRFLACCDNLEILSMLALPYELNLDAQHTLEDISTRCLSISLKTIYIDSFRVGDNEMEMVKYFLKNARVLETLRVRHWSGDVREEQQLEIRNKLMMSPRVSETCKVKLGILDWF